MASTVSQIQPFEYKEQQTVINGIGVSSLVPSFVVTKQGFQLCGRIYMVHMRRKYKELNLFLTPLYYATFAHYIENGVNPTEMYEKVYYDKNVYKRRDGVLNKNTNQVSINMERLSIDQRVVKHRGFTWTYRFVNAKFSDPNSPIDYGFSYRCCSINTILFISEKFRKDVGDYENYDYASFFENFLRQIHYDKALYMVNKKYHTLHRLAALQRVVEGRLMDANRAPSRIEV